MIFTIISGIICYYFGFIEGKRNLNKTNNLLNAENLTALYEEAKKYSVSVDNKSHPVLFELMKKSTENQLKEL